MSDNQLKTIETVSSFIEWLENTDIKPGFFGRRYWFRGHGDKTWELKPGVLREHFISRAWNPRDMPPDFQLKASCDNEIALNKEFRQDTASLLSSRDNLVEIYFLAQHHGFPTRLLDWTANPLTALFFAASSELKMDGEVIASPLDYRMTEDNPEAINKFTLAKSPFPQDNEWVVKTITYLFREGEAPELEMILPIHPDLKFSRILHQDARFTLHMPGTNSINENAVLRFNVPKELKREMQETLRRLGISWATLFPDLDHVSKEIICRRGYDIKKSENNQTNNEKVRN